MPEISSYANALKTNLNRTQVPRKSGGLENVVQTNVQQSNVPQNAEGLETFMQTLTQTVASLSQNMTNFMSSIQNTIQELLRAPDVMNVLIQPNF